MGSGLYKVAKKKRKIRREIINHAVAAGGGGSHLSLFLFHNFRGGRAQLGGTEKTAGSQEVRSEEAGNIEE